jgi:multicomponent Na+:H+ antiporter subunit E
MTRRSDRAARRARGWRLAWLWLVWVMLWGRLSVLTAVSGVVVAAAVLAAFPSPGPEWTDPAAGSRRVRPARVAALVCGLLAELVPASLGVAWQMIRFGPATPSAVLAVPLRSHDEVVSTLVANAISLAPGAAVIHVDRDQGLFYVHALTTGGPAALEELRAHVDDVQLRVMLALGHDLPDLRGGR